MLYVINNRIENETSENKEMTQWVDWSPRKLSKTVLISEKDHSYKEIRKQNDEMLPKMAFLNV